MKLEIIDKDKSKNSDRAWILVRKRVSGRYYHDVLYSDLDVKSFGDYIELPLKPEAINNPSGPCDRDICEVEFNSSVIGGYSINSELSFGLYSGFEVGIVYAFDIAYVAWLIENVDNFCIKDLDKLEQIGVFAKERDFLASREYGIPEYDEFIGEFRTIQELAGRVKILNTDIKLRDDVKHLNELKLRSFIC
jgi:hypothetical protein